MRWTARSVQNHSHTRRQTWKETRTRSMERRNKKEWEYRIESEDSKNKNTNAHAEKEWTGWVSAREIEMEQTYSQTYTHISCLMSALVILTTNYSRELPRYIYYKTKQFHVLIILSKFIYYDIWFPHELNKLELFNHRVCVLFILLFLLLLVFVSLCVCWFIHSFVLVWRSFISFDGQSVCRSVCLSLSYV